MKSFTETLKMIMLVKGNAVMLSKYVMEREQLAREEAIKNFADWVWAGWNLDLSKKDRAVKHYLEEKEGK